MIHDGRHDYESINGLPRRMKSYPKQFSQLSYYEHLQIAHMFDTMDIRKNVAKTLWRIFNLRSNKEKNLKICNDIEEANHEMKDIILFHINEDQVNINSLPWMLTEQQSHVVKEVMRKNKFPTGFCSNMKLL